MQRFIRSLTSFLRGTTGAVTIDYVVLSAAAAGTAIAAQDVVLGGWKTLVDNVNAESSGVDLSKADSTISYQDGFENGAAGWSWTGSEASMEISGIGSVLGPIAGTNGNQSVHRTFEIGEDVDYSQIKFDMYAMDSLSNETGYIYIGDQIVGELTKSNQGTVFKPRDIPGITIDATVVESSTQLGGRTGGKAKWKDGKAEITITLEKPDPYVKVGFGSDADQGTDDESFAVDNFQVTGLKDPDAP